MHVVPNPGVSGNQKILANGRGGVGVRVPVLEHYVYCLDCGGSVFIYM